MKQKYVIINDDKGNFRIVKKQSFRDVIIKSNENWSEISEENLIRFKEQIDKKLFKKVNRQTYANIKPEDRIQELELIAFTRTTGEDVENLLEDYDKEHGTKLKDEYSKLAYGDD